MDTELFSNKKLNEAEYSSGKVILQSTPTSLIFLTSYNCNMKCIFCFDRGDELNFSLGTYKNYFEPKLKSAISNAQYMYFTGWGEILLLPEINEFIDYLNRNYPEMDKLFTTNGMALNDELVEKLIEGRYALQISLHASSALLHCLITQTERFGQIEKQLRHIVMLKKEKKLGHPWLNLIFVITSLNIENLPDFIDFAGTMGANEVTCHYLTIFKPEHVKLSCFFLKETTNRIFAIAEERAMKYNMRLTLPPRFGMKKSAHEIAPCRDPWTHILVDPRGNILPCCYAGTPIGNLNEKDFMSIWNSQEYADLRGSLLMNKPNARCVNCSRASPSNIDDIRSHVTSRACKKEILKMIGLEE